VQPRLLVSTSNTNIDVCRMLSTVQCCSASMLLHAGAQNVNTHVV
jgi:hypothetical protein